MTASVASKQKDTTKEHFPIDDVIHFFGLGSVSHGVRSKIGRTNVTYFVVCSDGQEYAIRFMKYHNHDALRNEFFLHTILREQGVKAAYMLCSPDGNFLYKKDGVWATISRKIYGAHPRSPLSESEVFKVGQALSGLHCALQGYSLPHKNKRSSVNYNVVQERVDGVKDKDLRAKINEIIRHTTILPSENLPSGILHGDLHVSNVLINNDEVAILDLENAAEGLLITDIGRSIADICGYPNGLNPIKVKKYIEGYEINRILTEEEKECLYIAIAYRSAATSAWFINHSDFLNAQRFLSIATKAIELMS